MSTPQIAAKEFLQTSHKTIIDTLVEEQNHAQDVPSLIKCSKDSYSKENYNRAIEVAQSILVRDPANVEALNILTYSYYKKNEEKEAIEYCTRWIAANIQNPSIPLALLAEIYENKARHEEQARMKEEYARSIEQAKVEERNKIIADLSHSIKNLISTVIDPLENLKPQVMPEQQRAIENALRGTNLVREIVNAMNLSSKGAIEDFYYDAEHNVGKGGFSLQSIVFESLKYSISNMFDGKYFSNFMRKYFPTKEMFVNAKASWDNISQSEDTSLLFPFLQMYFFETTFALKDAECFVLGNEKGSAIKLLILFQEIILNAVKYSAFVPREKRLLSIAFSNTQQQLVMNIENRFAPDVKTKTSGLGHVIIENFAKLMNTKPVLNKGNDIYSMTIAFENFWERDCS